ncbi:carbamoyl-phosphate synthase domain-containing protein [Candidatus Carsonella ruddii]|uniref:Carbamoyl-phosphate synthase small chain n=1 Tax=Carsonella ruddii TaxID=114186 RepID=A0A1U9RRF6_CARRU|nr:carbamoyl-phosphate synthase domain-containing protein [Candidatus Carsonella ruddii]AQU89498.1 Carbamoyl-phosphate synthase small chain [Candidatus Carsonella ruddii]
MLIIESGYFLKCKIVNYRKILGELIFNSSNYGYNEIISDPSYKSQFLIFSNPHIGNVGIIEQDLQLFKIKLNAIIIKNYSISSNFRSNFKINKFLKKQKKVILIGIDNRFLISNVRNIGTQFSIIIKTKKKINIIIKYLRFLNNQKMYYD